MLLSLSNLSMALLPKWFTGVLEGFARAKCSLPSADRKPPDTLRLTHNGLISRSAWLLSKGTPSSWRKRSTASRCC